jgi:hypothetical protein
MTEPLIDVTAAPHAHHTSWAYDPVDNNYVLVLHNVADEPIGFVNYSYDAWIRAFENLQDAERHRALPT